MSLLATVMAANGNLVALPQRSRIWRPNSMTRCMRATLVCRRTNVGVEVGSWLQKVGLAAGHLSASAVALREGKLGRVFPLSGR